MVCFRGKIPKTPTNPYKLSTDTPLKTDWDVQMSPSSRNNACILCGGEKVTNILLIWPNCSTTQLFQTVGSSIINM